MCKKKAETVEHVVSGCEKMAQKEYKRRHDKLATMVHWQLCNQHKIKTVDQWYKHKPEDVTENEEVKILWDFSIQTDKVIEARRPDIVVLEKKDRKAKVIDIAVPNDKNVKEKEEEKIDKYTDLAMEMKKVWKLREVLVVPVVVGALGAISRKNNVFLEKLQLQKKSVSVLQKSAILGTARILRKVLNISSDGYGARC